MKRWILSALALFTCTLPLCAQLPTVEVILEPDADRWPISPLIYGINAYVYDSEWQSPDDWRVGLENHEPGLNVTNRRLGGNTMTSYNWENGFQNSGNDDNHSNNTFQSFITGAGSAPYEPGEALTTFHGHSLELGTYSLLQLPAAGYVAADANGPVSQAEAAPSPRWKQIVFDKPSPLSLTPDRNDAFVYVDEEINFLLDRYGNAASADGVDAYEMDNEPGLWHHWPNDGNEGTHSRLHPARTTAGEILERNIALAKTIRRMDPTAEIYGPAMWGYVEFYSLWNVYDEATGTSHVPSDWGAYDVEPYRTNNTGDAYRYNRMTWVNAYLAGMKAASDVAGRRLLDVFSVHYYPDFGAVETDRKRVQAPRSLWDPTFVETSWITQQGNGFTDGRSLELIPKLQQSIADFYPGTKLAITEYSFGGRHDVSGGLAQADALGIFGKLGVHAANYFFTVDDYIAEAFRLYRNYDGMNGTFGDTAIRATTSDVEKSSVYASMGEDGNLHVILINKSSDTPIDARVLIGGIPGSSSWESYDHYAFGATWPSITYLGNRPITGPTFTYSMLPLTAAHLVIRPRTTSVNEAEDRGSALTIGVFPSVLSDRGSVRASIPAAGRVRLSLFDPLGREVALIFDGEHSGGDLVLPVLSDDLPSGRYVARIVCNGAVAIAPVVVSR